MLESHWVYINNIIATNKNNGKRACNSIGRCNNEESKNNKMVLTDISTSDRNYILGNGKVPQSVVESCNRSMVSFNGYHSQCNKSLQHNLR